MAHIFISYSHKDKGYVHKLQEALRREGFEVWIDDRIDYGTEWPKVIQKHLDECDAFIVVVSENAFESKWVQNEVARADRKKKPIFPLLLHGEPWLSFEATQYIDVSGGNLPPERLYSRLEKVTIRRQIIVPPPKPTSPSVGGSGLWAVVMTKDNAGQSHFSDKAFPSEKIDQHWNENKEITSVTYAPNFWTVVMSTQTGYTIQSWYLNPTFPEKEIEAGWNAGKSITSAAYGDGSWCIVMSMTDNLSSQGYLLTSSFPTKYIKEEWDKGKRITVLAYGAGQWLVVMTNDKNMNMQSYRSQNDFPKDHIKEDWDKGYNISSLAYGNGLWVVVMSQETTSREQSWKTLETFPGDYIKSMYDDAYIISVLTNSFQTK